MVVDFHLLMSRQFMAVSSVCEMKLSAISHNKQGRISHSTDLGHDYNQSCALTYIINTSAGNGKSIVHSGPKSRWFWEIKGCGSPSSRFHTSYHACLFFSLCFSSATIEII